MDSAKEKQKNILIGQGLGSLVAARFYQEYLKTEWCLHGMILSSLPLRPNLEFPEWILSSVNSIKGPLARIRLPIKWTDSKLKDPLTVKNIPISTIREILKTASNIKSSCYFINIPTLFLVGERSKSANNQAIKLFSKGIPKKFTEFKCYKNSGHDLFNDLDRDKIYRDLYNWINNYFL